MSGPSVNPVSPEPWARPLPRGEHRTRLIECFAGFPPTVLSDGREDHFSAHAMFTRKVLREPWRVAFGVAVRFRFNPLAVEACELLADEWWEPTGRVRVDA